MGGNEVHALVLAHLTKQHADASLRLERLRSTREATSTATTGGSNRAIALGRRIREQERIVAGWSTALELMTVRTEGEETK